MITKIETDQTRPAVLAKIEELEREGKFDSHADPVDMSIAMPVTPDFPYIPKTPKQRLVRFFRKYFAVYPFTRKINKGALGTEICGKENLKGLGAAVVTCNHVTKFDCLAVQYALRPNRPFVVAAPFNNMKGRFGDLMRAGGMLPLGEDLATVKSFLTAVKTYLQKGKRILIYPEQAMWWNYKNPRPMKDGAFDIAVRNRVPILPIFITLRPSGVFDENGIEHQYLTLHIMPPIHPEPILGLRADARRMKAENERLWREKYKEVYGAYPTYSTRES